MNRILENFDENHMTSFYSDYLKKNIMVIISDELDSSEETLTDEYKAKISTFINKMSKWYYLVYDAILHWAKNEYDVALNTSDIELMIIYVLFEQSENELYGLSFRLSMILNMDVDFKLLYKMMIIGLSKLAQEKWPLNIKNFTISNGFV